MEQLKNFREEIDRIDEVLITTLALRFQITDKVGALKKAEKLPPVDPQREAEQERRIGEIAKKTGLREDIARSVLRLIIDTVVEDHKKASVPMTSCTLCTNFPEKTENLYQEL